jgi:predicted RNase H-like HicB family nuclease
MLLSYIESAMRKAKYEILEDDKSYYGEIQGFNGVYANSDNLEDCRLQLREVLEEWILVRVSKNLPLPRINGKTIKVNKVA